jgi:hypothetical protein
LAAFAAVVRLQESGVGTTYATSFCVTVAGFAGGVTRVSSDCRWVKICAIYAGKVDACVRWGEDELICGVAGGTFC